MTSHDDTEQDWSSFRFPARPPKRPGVEQSDTTSAAPTWAAPPMAVQTWHLDMDRLVIIHPVQRKKIDLHRVTTRRRLVQLVQTIRKQPLDADQAALWRMLDDACLQVFSCSLPELLATGPDQWSWTEEDDPRPANADAE